MSKTEQYGTLTLVSLEEMAPIMQVALERGQEVILTVTGNSMQPFLRHRRDRVVLAAAQPTALQPGDVPLYRRDNGQYVLHRVVERQEQSGLSYTMLGDAQTALEPGIAPAQIMAVAVAFIRGERRYGCDTPAYRRRVRRWHRLLPVRPALVWLCLFPGRVYNKLKRCLGR